jgi:5'-phosphate synthase pdxT subunit
MIGILALQGDVREHEQMLQGLGVSTKQVRKVEDLERLDGLVIPGGESTTIGRLATLYGLMEPLREAIAAGLPTYGTCAGLILLADRLAEGSQPLLGGLDVVVRRNAFGNQNDSFEADLPIYGMIDLFHAVFIRAPWIDSVGDSVEVLASWEGHPIMVRQGHILASAFHPELTKDQRIHHLFVTMTKEI